MLNEQLQKKVKQSIKLLQSVQKRYDGVYEWFTRDVFYSSDTDWNKVSTGGFGKPDFKKFLEDKFGIDLTL